MNKTLLALLLLIPFNLSAEKSEREYFDKWSYEYEIDDFTDVKSHLVQNRSMPGGDKFLIYFREPSAMTMNIVLRSKTCYEKSKRKEIPVLFRVDKKDVMTFYMYPKDDNKVNDRTDLIVVPNHKKNPELFDTLMFLFDLADGNSLKVRVDDPICNYKHDTEFSLKGFLKAFEPIFEIQAKQAKEAIDKRESDS